MKKKQSINKLTQEQFKRRAEREAVVVSDDVQALVDAFNAQFPRAPRKTIIRVRKTSVG